MHNLDRETASSRTARHLLVSKKNPKSTTDFLSLNITSPVRTIEKYDARGEGTVSVALSSASLSQEWRPTYTFGRRGGLALGVARPF
jgi:hypothetical protein